MVTNINARSTKELIKIFNALVEEATREFGQSPMVCLEEYEDDEDGEGEEFRAALCCRVAGKPEIKKLFGGYGTLTKTPTSEISTDIHESEILVVLELIRNYKQPDKNFQGGQ